MTPEAIEQEIRDVAATLPTTLRRLDYLRWADTLQALRQEAEAGREATALVLEWNAKVIRDAITALEGTQAEKANTRRRR